MKFLLQNYGKRNIPFTSSSNVCSSPKRHCAAAKYWIAAAKVSGAAPVVGCRQDGLKPLSNCILLVTLEKVPN